MIDTAPLMTILVNVDKPVDLGLVAGQARRFVRILGGSVSGVLSGVVLPGGADWQEAGPDGMLEIDARYVLDLDGALVEVRSTGLRHGSPEVLGRLARGEIVPGSEYYFRTAMRFFTASPDLVGLNSTLAVAVGERQPGQVRLTVHAVK